MHHVVPVKEGKSLQDLSHQSLHVFFFEGFVSVGHTLVKNLPSCRTEHGHKQTHSSTDSNGLKILAQNVFIYTEKNAFLA